MGRKGKNSNYQWRHDGQGKWAAAPHLNRWSYETSLEQARKSAYDAQILEKKRAAQCLKHRRRLVFPHLNYLLNEAKKDSFSKDWRLMTNQQAVQDMRQRYSQDWLTQFRKMQSSGSFRDAQRELQHQSFQFYNQLLQLHGSPNDTKFPSLNQRVGRASKQGYCRDDLLGTSGEAEVPTLKRLCIQTVGKYLQHYEPDDVQYACNTLSSSDAELLALWCAVLNTGSDAYCGALQHELAEHMYFSKEMSDKGLREYAVNSQRQQLQQLVSSLRSLEIEDCWDTIAWDDFEFNHRQLPKCSSAPTGEKDCTMHRPQGDETDHHSRSLASVTFLGSEISLNAISVLNWDRFDRLQLLIFHDVQFAAGCLPANASDEFPQQSSREKGEEVQCTIKALDGQWSGKDPTIRCLDILSQFSCVGHFPKLLSLEFHHCHWIDLQALLLWSNQIADKRRGDFKIASSNDSLTAERGGECLPALLQLNISGFCLSRWMSDTEHATINSDCISSSKWSGDEGIHFKFAEVRSSFEENCGINLDIT